MKNIAALDVPLLVSLKSHNAPSKVKFIHWTAARVLVPITPRENKMSDDVVADKPCILILEKGCVDCSVIHAALSMPRVSDPTYKSRDNKRVWLFVSMSPDGTTDLLERFNAVGHKAPVLIMDNDKVLSKPNEIISTLKMMRFIP